MGKISTYNFDTAVTVDDFLVGTDFEDSNITKSYLIGDIIALVPDVTWGSITGTLSNQTDLQTALNAKQDTLVSGTNIKTINSITLLGAGDLAVQEVLVSGTNIKTVGGISLLGSGDIPNSTAQYVFQIKGTSYDLQSPSGNTALKVEFGATQTSTNVEILSSGNVVFSTAGNYLVNTFISVTKEGVSGNVSVFAFRALINGVQAGDPKVFKIIEAGLLTPYELTVPVVANANDILTYEIMKDSSGNDSGRLEGTNLLGWVGTTPSAQIEVWKNV
tara:strand:+ start:239 stop:1063 length:825 start_codon:yes stop_codon:yes gene_type:complete